MTFTYEVDVHRPIFFQRSRALPPCTRTHPRPPTSTSHEKAVRKPPRPSLMTPSVPLAGYTPSTLLGAPKGERLHLRLRAHGRSLTLVKVRGESVQHVLMKGFLWAMLLPQHPDLLCEVNANHHYKPDVGSFSERGVPLCWGECGAVTTEKLSQLASEFPSTHFVVSKWAHSDIRGYAQQLRLELALPPRAAPFEVVSIPDNCSDEHITRDGEVTLSRQDLQIEQIAELI